MKIHTTASQSDYLFQIPPPKGVEAECLIPPSPIGKELYERFAEMGFRKKPSESPIARILMDRGYEHHYHPLYPKYTRTDWLASRVSMGGLSIVFRQPTPIDLLVCSIDRETEERKMRSPLLGITEFFSLCRYACPGLQFVGGRLDKSSDAAPGNLSMERLASFYHRFLGDVESYQYDGGVWIFARVHQDERFNSKPLWKRYKHSASRPNISLS